MEGVIKNGLSNHQLHVKNCFYLSSDVPGQPGEPKAIDTSLSHITLKWDAPKRDGGNPVAGYQVEKQLEGKDDWVR